jgi:hypothetical protein
MNKKSTDIIKRAYMKLYGFKSVKINTQRIKNLHVIVGHFEDGSKMILGCLEDCTITVWSTPIDGAIYRVYNRNMLIGDIHSDII